MARLTSQLGIAALEDAWRTVTGEELPKAAYDYLAGRPQEEWESSDR